MRRRVQRRLIPAADTPSRHRADDLIPEESPDVQLALKRLSPKEAYDRVFRMRRAVQVYLYNVWEVAGGTDGRKCSIAHQLLPKNEWTKPQDVGRYRSCQENTYMLTIPPGLPIPLTNHPRHRDGEDGARRPRDDANHQAQVEEIEAKNLLKKKNRTRM